MRVTELGLPGVKLIVPDYFDDNRGHSAETYNDRVLRERGIGTRFLVDYECYNREAGTVRGIHFQNNPHPQTKLVRVLSGSVMDYVVDLRRDSRTFRKWIRQKISASDRTQIYLPSGYGHAYVTLEPNTVVLYKFDDYYDRSLVRGIRWNDPDLALKWDIEAPVLSRADSSAPWFCESDVNLNMEVNA